MKTRLAVQILSADSWIFWCSQWSPLDTETRLGTAAAGAAPSLADRVGPGTPQNCGEMWKTADNKKIESLPTEVVEKPAKTWEVVTRMGIQPKQPSEIGLEQKKITNTNMWAWKIEKSRVSCDPKNIWSCWKLPVTFNQTQGIIPIIFSQTVGRKNQWNRQLVQKTMAVTAICFKSLVVSDQSWQLQLSPRFGAVALTIRVHHEATCVPMTCPYSTTTRFGQKTPLLWFLFQPFPPQKRQVAGRLKSLSFGETSHRPADDVPFPDSRWRFGRLCLKLTVPPKPVPCILCTEKRMMITLPLFFAIWHWQPKPPSRPRLTMKKSSQKPLLTD